MINEIIKHIIRFGFLLLFQAIVINKIELMDGLVLPFVYIFALLMLPFNTPRWALLLIGFIYGLSLDAFTNTLGMHTSACLVLVFAQPFVLRLLSPREGYELNGKGTIQKLGLTWYLLYAGILTLIHHFWLFYIEIFRFTDFFTTFLKVILSSVATLIFLTLGQYLIFKSKEKS